MPKKLKVMCIVCGITRNSSLNRHKYLQHYISDNLFSWGAPRDTIQLKAQCTVCSKDVPQNLMGAHMLGLHVTVPCPLCRDKMFELDELIKHMMSHRVQYVQIRTDLLIADDISTSASEAPSTSKSHKDVLRIRQGMPTPLADRAAAYKSLTQHAVSRSGPLIWPSHFKGPETLDQTPSFKFSPPAKIQIPEFSASETTQIASSNAPTDPNKSSSNKAIPVLLRFSSPTPPSQIPSSAVPDVSNPNKSTSKFPFPSTCPGFFKSTVTPVSPPGVTASSSVAAKVSHSGNIFSSLLIRPPATPHLQNQSMKTSDAPIFGKVFY